MLNALSRIVYEQGWHDQAFIANQTDNFDAFKAKNLTQDLDEAVRVTGIAKDQLMQAAEWIAKPKTETARRRTFTRRD